MKKGKVRSGEGEVRNEEGKVRSGEGKVRSVWVVLVLVLGACDPGFDVPTEVYDFRILAIRTDPPEHIYKSSVDDKGMPVVDLLSIMASPQIKSTLLLSSPGQEDSMVSYRLEGCILDGNLNCTEGLPRTVFGEGESLPGELEIVVTLPPDLVVKSWEADPYFGIFGWAVWLSGEVVQGDVAIPFLKAFIFSPDSGQGREANSNPTILGILEGEEDKESAIELDGKGVYQVKSGEEYRLLADISEDDRETYVVMALPLSELEFTSANKREEVMALSYEKEITEDMTISFFGTCGKFSSESKSEKLHILFETEEDKKDKDLSVDWTAPAESEDCTLWFIATDGRGGVGWYALEVSVQ